MTASMHSISIRVAAKSFRIVLAVTIVFLALFGLQDSNANEPCCQVICAQSAALKCAAEEMRDDLKCHMRDADRYGKMLIVNSRIKLRSASIHRRIDRNPCYRGMDRDVQKLNELACEFVLLYNNAISCSSCDCGKRNCGCTACIGEKLAVMVALADSIRAASLGLIPVSGAQVEAFSISDVGSNHQIESPVPPVVFDHPVRVAEVSSSLILAGPKVDQSRPVAKSVLEK